MAQRLRVRYAKRGRMRFSSHRDFQRALERALRRMDAPMAYSAGFTPHPRISYANAAPTGAGSEAEYLEVGLIRPVDAQAFARSLDAALPPGLDIVEAVEVRTPNLADRLQASLWRIELPGVPAQDAEQAVRALLALPSAEITKSTKSGNRTVDVRTAVVDAQVDHHAGRDAGPRTGLGRGPEAGQDIDTARPTQGEGVNCAILRLVVRHTTPAVRPDDVLAALASRGLLAPPSPPRMTRLAQGPLDGRNGTVADPLVADRGVVGA